MQKSIILGTRGSKLALAQADIAAERIRIVDPSLSIIIKKITTAGDRDLRTSLSKIGGKGVFIRELEQALLNNTIDVAVHSFKDITSSVPSGLEMCSFFSPESVCDVLISRENLAYDKLPHGARIGTGSMRRRVLLSRMRPDFQFLDIRGNIDTRLSKLNNGSLDAIVLSEAGLIRLGLQDKISWRFDPAIFYPAPGQGIITLEIRQSDTTIKNICLSAGDDDQRLISLAELSALTCLGFDCRTPFGVYTRASGNNLNMQGFYVNPFTGNFIEKSVSGPNTSYEELGKKLADILLERGN
ncbi:MAG TPA: hydroxymethylbilane synthase [Chitinispirillaceae bacterium]|nr:hydroxymethylbilane synthase [Chitinispirillaceae bacterium]